MVSKTAFSKYLKRQEIKEKRYLEKEIKESERKEEIKRSTDKRRDAGIVYFVEKVKELGRAIKERKKVDSEIKKIEIERGLIKVTKIGSKRMLKTETEEDKKLREDVRRFFKKYTCESINKLGINDAEDIKLIEDITGCKIPKKR